MRSRVATVCFNYSFYEWIFERVVEDLFSQILIANPPNSGPISTDFCDLIQYSSHIGFSCSSSSLLSKFLVSRNGYHPGEHCTSGRGGRSCPILLIPRPGNTTSIVQDTSKPIFEHPPLPPLDSRLVGVTKVSKLKAFTWSATSYLECSVQDSKRILATYQCLQHHVYRANNSFQWPASGRDNMVQPLQVQCYGRSADREVFWYTQDH